MTLRSTRLVLVLAASAALFVGACSSAGGTPAPTPVPTGGPKSPPPASAPAGGAASSAAAASAAGGDAFATCPKKGPAPMAAGQTRTVTIETPSGKIVIKVQGSLGPLAAANFVALASCGYYTNVVFHRLVPGFVIQGGDGQYGRLPNVTAQVGQGGPGYEFADDPVSVPYTRGVVAMANSGPNTNGSQFFIVLADAQLPPSYSVFGQVTAGLDVVDAIAAMPNSGGQANAAVNPVPMTKVTVATP